MNIQNDPPIKSDRGKHSQFLQCFVTIAIFWCFFATVVHILMLFQAEICLCGRDRCNNDDPIPEVEKQANPPPTYIWAV